MMYYQLSYVIIVICYFSLLQSENIELP